MPMVDPFVTGGYSLTTLTAAINKLPNKYGILEQMNLMPTKSISTRSFEVEERNGVLHLLPTRPWGSPGYQNTSGKRKTRSFAVPHMPVEDYLLASDVQGIRQFGTENTATPFDVKLSEKLQDMRDKVDITLEWRRWGALKGQILDGDGTSVIYDLFTEFGITKKTIDFLLGTATTDVRAKCMEVKRWIEDNLFGERFTRIHVFVSQEFFDKLTSHANVVKVYQNWAAAQEKLGGDVRSGFEFGGLLFEEYRGQVSSIDSAYTTRRFIAANAGIAFPLGTSSMFATYAAPADFVETVNTLGQQYYAKMEPMKYNRGFDLHAQSNVLPFNMRPDLGVEIITSN